MAVLFNPVLQLTGGCTADVSLSLCFDDGMCSKFSDDGAYLRPRVASTNRRCIRPIPEVTQASDLRCVVRKREACATFAGTWKYTISLAR